MGAIRKIIPLDSPYTSIHNMVGTIVAEDLQGRTFDVSDITTTNIRDVLDESINKIEGLCTSYKINPWALFRPSGSAPYKMGDFAGYNHQANPTTYVFIQPASGTYTIYRAPLSPYETTVSFAIILKKGERPPVSPRDWRYIRITAILTGGITGTYSVFSSATDAYDPFIVTIPVPSNDPITFTMAMTAYYVDDSNSYTISEIESSINTITVNAAPDYLVAPSLLADNPYTPAEVRHYFIRRTGYNPPVLADFYYSGAANDLQIEDGNFYHGLIKGIPDDSSVLMYGETYNYTVFQTGSQFVKIDLKEFYRAIGYKFTDDMGIWYEVESIASGYSFWRILSYVTDVEILAGWPAI